MSPIPQLDHNAHPGLKDRIETALLRCDEAPGIEFKESQTWDRLSGGIVRTSMGMSNTRDGGIIIIGVSQRADVWQLTGIEIDHFNTFETDAIRDKLQQYARPMPHIEIVSHTFRDMQFLVIQVHEFDDFPCVCVKGGEIHGRRFEPGHVYIRTTEGRRETAIIKSADAMRDLIELAAEKRARALSIKCTRIGALWPTQDDSGSRREFDAELGEL